ncbi:hypothetical protein B1757_13785 [Acidithiobacillus marinus]|uniref:Restriction endonuclease type IV Mrr domain-containing protein n=1 Tax=Acidithiobacillus marinus TaxID=187490 RepID=A0A2I1DIH1_9PROT|nr:restriction endonuclease [Acidithiobacillus marinus]PKY09669.1 hypothetical protein B1757_13785 [Acidithiobacillus marinus]
MWSMTHLKTLVVRALTIRGNQKAAHKAGHKHRITQGKKSIKKISDITGNDTQATFARRLAYLRSIDPLVFEELVLEAFQRDRYPIRRNQRYTGDGGLDGQVYMDEGWWAIQCKRYRGAVNKAHIEQFRVDAQREGCVGGIFVHTGKTPKNGKHLAQGVTIISGSRLTSWLAGECPLREN